MNIYVALVFCGGQSKEHIVQGSDVINALLNSTLTISDVVSIKLIGSADKMP